MNCIYLNCDKTPACYCHAQPIRQGEVVAYYKPTEDELKKYCQIEDFDSCPRFEAFQNKRT